MYNNLRKLRLLKNISVDEIIKALGLKYKQAYYKKEVGNINFTLEEAKTIAKLFNMSIEEIFFKSQFSEMEKTVS